MQLVTLKRRLIGNALPIRNQEMAKDKSDNRTIDSFADLLETLETQPAEARKKPGPKPRGERAMTPAEKQKAYRDRVRQGNRTSPE